MSAQTPPQIRTVEALVEEIANLKPALGDQRDALTLWPNRLHLARNAGEAIELFVEGPRESFGQGAVGHALEFGNYCEMKDGREFPALVIRTGIGGGWVRPMAHLSYEALQAVSQNPDISNEDLVEAIGPYLRLVIDRQLLSMEQQLGLAGELVFLHQVLTTASEIGVSAQTALSRWTGWDSASRDFKGGAVAVEVKTTGGPVRHHWVHPMYQLLPQPGTSEQVYVFSVGLRVDRSRSYKLTTAVERVLESLTGDTRQAFLGKLAQYAGVGFEMAQWRQYELEPGFFVALAPTLHRVDRLPNILRPESFAGDGPPERVLELTYRVDLDGLPGVSETERESLLRELLLGGSDRGE